MCMQLQLLLATAAIDWHLLIFKSQGRDWHSHNVQQNLFGLYRVSDDGYVIVLKSRAGQSVSVNPSV
jgi:hypothetical protein